MKYTYTFPVIERIEDVLPYIADCDEIKVSDKGDYKVINYVVQTNDTFPPIYSNYEVEARMRRECRGLIFDKDGKLISRPFHKFFNVGEREETQPEHIDLSEHVIFEKCDGSMIRPIVLDGVIHLGTKMGITDIALDAKAWLYAQPDHKKKLLFLEWATSNNVTPILEWVSPTNKIVVNYKQEDLILLALRDNRSGLYYDVRSIPACPFTVVTSYNNQSDIKEFVEKVKTDTSDREGFVLRDAVGHMYKIKTNQYVDLHRIKDEVQRDRHILRMILEERIDDILPKLDIVDFDKVLGYQERFWSMFNTKVASLAMTFSNVKHMTKKDFAITVMPKMDKRDGKFMFGAFDGKDIRDMVLAECDKKSTKNVNYDDLEDWLLTS